MFILSTHQVVQFSFIMAVKKKTFTFFTVKSANAAEGEPSKRNDIRAYTQLLASNR